MCSELQAMWHVWEGTAQSGGAHPGQEVSLYFKPRAKWDVMTCPLATLQHI